MVFPRLGVNKLLRSLFAPPILCILTGIRGVVCAIAFLFALNVVSVNYWGSWEFTLPITDENGEPIPGVRFHMR